MLISHLQRGIWEFHFPFTCILYGKCFGISVTHFTSDLEVPGSSPGVSNNLFSSFFFLFWPFNDHEIENRPPNSSPWRIQFLVRWSVKDRPPIDFVRIFFLYLLLLGGLLNDRSPIVFVRIFFIRWSVDLFSLFIRWSVEKQITYCFCQNFLYLLLLLFFIFIYFLHFFVPRITQVLFSQFHSILSHQ